MRTVLCSLGIAALLPTTGSAQRSGRFVVDVLSQTEPAERRLDRDYRLAGTDTNAVFRAGSFEVSWRPKRKRPSPSPTRPS